MGWQCFGSAEECLFDIKMLVGTWSNHPPTTHASGPKNFPGMISTVGLTKLSSFIDNSTVVSHETSKTDQTSEDITVIKLEEQIP